MTHICSDRSLMRERWIYETAPGGGFIGYREENKPYIKWKHIDGPLLVARSGRLHWLTWRERFLCWLGIDDAITLEKKRWGK